MNISATLTEKKTHSSTLKKNYGLFQKFKPLGLIQLSDSQISDELIEGLKVLSAGFVIVNANKTQEQIAPNVIITDCVDPVSLAGFDFIVTDDSISQVSDYTSAGVTPIINKDNHLNSILKEFNPMQNIGNAFFYETNNPWSIFYTIVRYMENYKFPFDNKNLIKNVLDI
ncbi:MAG: hypothetical protein GY828_06940 [Candidatus Gracilibacteria bacterium]|nr:hypothetical protein [Candidatus Gracilibacteria bacterium]